MNETPFATLGNITIDDLVFADGTTRWCVPGGNAIYSALGMAVSGEESQVIAPIGPEYPAASIDYRIDLSACRVIPRNLRNWGLYEEDGTRIFTFRSHVANWLDFSPTAADLGTRVYANAHIAPLPWQLQLELAAALRENGTRLISLDPDERHVQAMDPPSLRRLLGQVDMFLPSRQEAQAICPNALPLDALRSLRDLAPQLQVIVVKCGADGVLGHRAGARDYLRLPALAAEVVDQTGAGDAFCGAALVGFARTGNLIDALVHGAVAASFAVAGLGPAGLLAASPELAAERRFKLGDRVEHRAF